MLTKRTGFAFGFSVWNTERFPKLHNGLGEVFRVLSLGIDCAKLLLNHLFRGGEHDIIKASQHARDDAQDISVNGRLGFSKGDRSDGACGIIADARKLAKIRGFLREIAAVFCHDLYRGFFEIACAAVIAKRVPMLVELIVIDLGERFDVGKLREKSMVIGNDGFDARLLEHDLGDPNVIGGGLIAPWQGSLMFLIP